MLKALLAFTKCLTDTGEATSSFVYEVTLSTPLAEDQIAGESPQMANVSGLMNVLKIYFQPICLARIYLIVRSANLA